MPYPQQTFSTFTQLLTYINNNWITNGNGDITGVIGNNVVNGLLTFIEQSPINWQRVEVIDTTGAVDFQRPTNVIINNAPSSVAWSDNIYNEVVIINATNNVLALRSGMFYFNPDLVARNSIPQLQVLRLMKAENGLWLNTSSIGSGGGGGNPPLVGVVGAGGPDDPAVGSLVFTSTKLINLGATNAGRIQIFIDDIPMTNYGQNSSFSFDGTFGTITLSFGPFQALSGLYIDLNQ